MTETPTAKGRGGASAVERLPRQTSRGRDGDVTIRSATATCSLGFVLAAATQRGICAILLGDDPVLLLSDLRARFPDATLLSADQEFGASLAAVRAAIDDPATPFLLPLDLRGTAFRRRVWQALRSIPAGATTTYGSLAAHIGSPRAIRAVAGACAANPVAVVVPCHRVVAANGHPRGYRWGIERKVALLARERVDPRDIG